MLLPLKFILNDCLNSHFDVKGRREFARIVGRGEPCVRKWENDKNIPSNAVDKFIEHFEKMGGSALTKEIQAIGNEPHFAEITAIQWQFFCQGMLANNDPFLAGTLKEIYDFSKITITATQNILKLDLDQRFDAYKSFLTDTIGPKFGLPQLIREKIDHCSDWNELRPNLSWFVMEVFIYFMALAEVEYLQTYYQISESKIVEWALPQQKKEKILLPLNVFFGNFFDRLISRGHYHSHDAIAEKLTIVNRGSSEVKNKTYITKESAWREIKRAKYQKKAPSFETFSAWIDALVPSEISSSKYDFELEKQLLIDLFGAARIMDKVYRESRKELTEGQLLSHFQRYRHWYDFHCNAWPSARKCED